MMIRLVAIFFALILTGGGSSAQTIRVTVDTAVVGNLISRQFVGFSFNPAYTVQYFGTSYNGNNDRVISAQLFHNFTPYQFPAIRIIGANNSWWKGLSPFNAAPANFNNTPSFACTFCPGTTPSYGTTIDSADLNDMRGFLALLNYKPQVLFGLNSSVIDSARTANFAMNIKSKLSVLDDLQFEIGNEPDLFTNNNRRLNGYNIVPYVKEFNLLAKATAPYGFAAAPAFARTNNASANSWSDSLFYLIDSSGGRIKTITLHDYPLGNSSNNSTVASYLNKYLSNQYSYDAVSNAVTGLMPSINLTNSRGLSFRMAEVNSIAGGGVDSASNCFGAALWSIDYMFELARAGGAGINFSTEGASNVYYSPFTYHANFTGSGKVGIRPQYYGMLLFARAVQGNARLIKQTFTSAIDSNQVKVWSVKDTAGTIRTLVINRGTSLTDVSSATIQLTLPGRVSPAKVYLLKASSANGIADTTGISIAGQTVNTMTGVLDNAENFTTVNPVSGVYSITVKAATAVVIEVVQNPCVALAPAAVNASRCGAGTITIAANPSFGETIDWYSNPSGGVPVLSGSNLFNFASLSSSTIMYAQARNLAAGCVSAVRTPVNATILPLSTISLLSVPASNVQTITAGNAIATISYGIGGGATGGTVIGLPAGVNAVYSNGVFTISGTPAQLGVFNFTVSSTGSSCTEVSASGSITIVPIPPSSADYFSKANGLFSDAATWEYSNGFSTVPATVAPTGLNNITIQNGHIVSLDVNHTVAASRTLRIVNGQLLVMPNTRLDVLAGGVIDFNGQPVTIQSTATGTGSIGRILGTLSGASNVTVERFIPANSNRAWRLLSVPTAGMQTIRDAWQNGQPTAVSGPTGSGTWITSKLANAVANGYDARSVSSSLLLYNPALNLWEGVSSSTTAAALSTDAGYMLFVRGDRTATSLYSTITPTTLRTKGSLKIGTFPATPISIDAGQFAVVGNPYAAAIDLKAVGRGGGLDNVFYVWDPKLTGSYNVGGIQTLSYNGSNYVITPGGGSYGAGGAVMDTIQHGQAFIVHATGVQGTIQFNENCKLNGSRNVFRPQQPAAQLQVSLLASRNGTTSLADGVMLSFDRRYHNGVDGNDALKFAGFGEQIGIKKDTLLLSVEYRSRWQRNDSIQLQLSGLRQQQYALEVNVNNLPPSFPAIQLKDRYLDTSIDIASIGASKYTFAVTPDTASVAPNRFVIVPRRNGKNRLVDKMPLIWPNPVAAGQVVHVTTGKIAIGSSMLLQLFGTDGRLLLYRVVANKSGVYQFRVPVDLMPGVYRVCIIDGKHHLPAVTLLVTEPR